jgi:hypothetical protein
MKKIIFISISILALSSNILAKSQGEELFMAKCVSCHTMSRPKDESTAIAPPIKGVMFHLKEAFADDKKTMIKHINDFVLNPTKEKAICESVQRFGLMPSQKGSITTKELAVLSQWMVDNLKAGQGKNKKH